MTSTFKQRMQLLSRQVGDGHLTGHVVVDQVYAKYQHEGLDLKHPRGGHALYLTEPLFTNRNDYFEDLARTALDDGGKSGMISAMEHLAGEVADQAPVLWGDLRRSGHPFVDDNGVRMYDRAPLARRLTEEELRAKAMMTPMSGELLGYLWWHVMHHVHPPGRF